MCLLGQTGDSGPSTLFLLAGPVRRTDGYGLCGRENVQFVGNRWKRNFPTRRSPAPAASTSGRASVPVSNSSWLRWPERAGVGPADFLLTSVDPSALNDENTSQFTERDQMRSSQIPVKAGRPTPDQSVDWLLSSRSEPLFEVNYDETVFTRIGSGETRFRAFGPEYSPAAGNSEPVTFWSSL